MTDSTDRPVPRTRRRILLLAGFTALSSLFALDAFQSYTPLRFISVSREQAIMLVALAAVAAVGALLGARVIAIVVGVALIAIGVVRLITFGVVNAGFLSGGVNTGALVVGMGLAFVAVWIADRPLRG